MEGIGIANGGKALGRQSRLGLDRRGFGWYNTIRASIRFNSNFDKNKNKKALIELLSKLLIK